jgi:hypothetical protein
MIKSRSKLKKIINCGFKYKILQKIFERSGNFRDNPVPMFTVLPMKSTFSSRKLYRFPIKYARPLFPLKNWDWFGNRRSINSPYLAVHFISLEFFGKNAYLGYSF